MKMRTVIEAGRQASPLVNEGLSEMKSKLDSFRQLLSDLSSVKSDVARNAVVMECERAIGSLSGTLVDTISKWGEFDSTLSSYRRKFGRVKISQSRDLPGQQMLFSEDAGGLPRQDETENP